MVLETRGDSKEASGELIPGHPGSVVNNDNPSPVCIVKVLTVDDDLGGIGIVRVLDELDQCCGIAPNQEFAQLSEQMSVDGEPSHARCLSGKADATP